jgi:N utilization substance protein B
VRRSGRAAAVQVLYGLDAGGSPAAVDAALERHFDNLAPETRQETRRFAGALCRGVTEHLERIDAALERASTNWRVERMSRVDRSILRLAVYELHHGGAETPPAVVINEAIELGKQFGSTGSASFINGVLGRVVEQLEAEAGGG